MTPRVKAAKAKTTSYRNDDEIEGIVGNVLGTALRRQVWLMFFDDEHRPKPLVIPIHDLPTIVDDVGIRRIAAFAREVGMRVGARRVVLTWERPGPAAVTAEEETLFERMATRFAATPDVSLRAQLLSHSVGVRLVRPAATVPAGPAEAAPRAARVG